ncbi:MAG: four helix bundle protein [Minisyncoccota bacterium]
MSEHKDTLKHPAAAQIPLVLVRAKEAYRAWHNFLIKVNRVNRYTIGARTDEMFLSLLELIFRATFAYDKFEKLSIVSQALGKNDLLKFFLQIGWEEKVLDNKSYGALILDLDGVGRMLGGWKKNLQEKTPTSK